MTSKPDRKTPVQTGLDAVLTISLVVLFLAIFFPWARFEELAIAPLAGGALISILEAIRRIFRS